MPFYLRLLFDSLLLLHLKLTLQELTAEPVFLLLLLQLQLKQLSTLPLQCPLLFLPLPFLLQTQPLQPFLLLALSNVSQLQLVLL